MRVSPAGRPRLIAATALAALAALAASTAPAAADTLPPEELRGITDTYVFDYSLGEFTSVSADRPYEGQLDWSNDGCSYSPDQPLGNDFLPGCVRHDFGYRNFKLQERFTEDNRARIDGVFRDDLYGICDGDWVCRGVADIYYAAVRAFGGQSADTGEALERGEVEEKAELLMRTAEEVESADDPAEAERLLEGFEESTGVELATEHPAAG
ncbi:phospholipase [Nocardiopsis composta]|uniref:Phospholipase A2 n=1 Tax=Nocardiopsis composta TaxID=157465 RepID=A0A7W8QR16_9ACTN|nr:phospholipase [Nocardiopsis composta]MBB5435020.1 hypothetical protein [Nocardiopsis composta]